MQASMAGRLVPLEEAVAEAVAEALAIADEVLTGVKG